VAGYACRVATAKGVAKWSDGLVRAVLDVIRAVSVHRDRHRLFAAITDALRPVLRFDFLGIVLAGPGPDELTPYFMIPRTAVSVVRRSQSALDELFRTGAPVYVRSREAAAAQPGTLRILERIGAHSYLALPLTANGRTIAALILHSKRPDDFDDGDLWVTSEISTAIALALEHCLAYEEIARSRDHPVADNQLLREALKRAAEVGGVVTESPAMREVVRLVELVAPTEATVLVTGETGAGKERIARLIHDRSSRAAAPMVCINCAAIPSALIESELFGHEAGAFTGALRRRRGRFELAHQRTLLLDEVGELSLDAQARLLRVLQNQQLERVGGNETIEVDVRIIAATHRDLPAMVAAGSFRGDLYYRLAVFPIALPSLSERPEDIPELARELVARAARRLGRAPPHVDDDTIAALRRYSWPGNVRELENVLERAVILSRAGILDVAPLLDGIAANPPPDRPDERNDLRQVLAATRGVIEGPVGAAARLGVSPSTLRSRMRRLGVERPK
jgi:formate hydrogenlyase transcriptional activator